jgi:hypothetical protein
VGNSCSNNFCTAEFIVNVPVLGSNTFEIGNNTVTGGNCAAGAPATCTVSGFYVGGAATANVYNNLFGYSGAKDLQIVNARLYNNNFVGLVGLPLVSSGNLAIGSPLFSGGIGSFRIGPTSPFLDAGTSAFTQTAVDLDGNPRTNGGQVDIGAYEVQETIFRDGVETLL